MITQLKKSINQQNELYIIGLFVICIIKLLLHMLNLYDNVLL